MLVIQHIWTRWTKLSRGANSPLQRVRPAEAYPLALAPVEAGEALIQEVRALEAEGFLLAGEARAMNSKEWREAQWNLGVRLDWIDCGDEAPITLRKDTRRQQTRWPAYLPSPLFTLGLGDVALIDWNGRFRSSLFGSNRSSYFEQHRYWLALVPEAEADPRLFLDAKPRKHIDLRSHIY